MISAKESAKLKDAWKTMVQSTENHLSEYGLRNDAQAVEYLRRQLDWFRRNISAATVARCSRCKVSLGMMPSLERSSDTVGMSRYELRILKAKGEAIRLGIPLSDVLDLMG